MCDVLLKISEFYLDYCCCIIDLLCKREMNMNPSDDVRTPWKGDRPVTWLPHTQKKTMQTCISSPTWCG